MVKAASTSRLRAGSRAFLHLAKGTTTQSPFLSGRFFPRRLAFQVCWFPPSCQRRGWLAGCNQFPLPREARSQPSRRARPCMFVRALKKEETKSRFIGAGSFL